MDYLFYLTPDSPKAAASSKPKPKAGRAPGAEAKEVSPGGEESFRSVWWRPNGTERRPPGVEERSFFVWWLFHRLKIFSNGGYAVALIFDGDRLIHRSCVFPGYFRFPFMAADDLQIGDTWTDPAYRGRGLATRSAREIVERATSEGRRVWYVVEKGNGPSIRVAEKAGMELRGEGARVSRAGVRALGAYRILRSIRGEA
jgi:RimJ/RimL family protein N-acetyltransferase